MSTALALALATALFMSFIPPASSGLATGAPAAPEKPSSWVGVGELVVAKLDATGAVSGTPYQHTELTVSSNGTQKVAVPMSASGERALGKGNAPPISGSVAQFSETPNGTTTQNVRSDFTTPLPLKVTPSYQLNGKSTTAADLAPTKHHLRKQYQSGTLKVIYKLTNITKAKTTVSFEGFNGAHVTRTISQPLPLIGEFKITFPKDATNITAPNATLATGESGVGATWTLTFAPPLSPASQTVSYSMHVDKAKIPDATVEAEVVEPSTPTGKAPQASAAALASVEAAAEPGLGGPPVSLGGTRSDLDRTQRSTSSNVTKQTHASKRAAEDKSKSASSLSRIQGNFTQLTTDQSNAEQSGATSTDTQLTNLQGAANGAVTILAGEVNSSALHAAGDLGASMSAFARTVSDLVANTVANSSLAKNHAAAVDALKSAVDVLVTLAKNLDDVVQQHATDAKALDVLFTKLLADSAAFPVPEQTAPEWITLATDLAAAKVKADLVSKVAADIAQRAAQLRSAVEDLHDKLVTTVDADAHSLSAKADQIRTDVTGDLETEQGKVQASIGNISNGLATFNAQVVDAQSSIAGARTEAQTSLSNERSKASASLANAKDAVQAGVNEAVGSVQTALDKANSDYAQWVALVQIAHAHQLPGGNATGANVQNGAYVYRISGTA